MRFTNKKILSNGNIVTAKPIVMTGILLAGLMVGAMFSMAGFDAAAAAAVQTTTSNTTSSALRPVVQITNVHTVPAVVAKGSNFKIAATVVNHSDKAIRFTRDCSPLTPQAIFNTNNVIKINQKVCNILAIALKILPGNSVNIEIPGTFGGIFHATDAGKVNSVIAFKYINEKDSPTTNTIQEVKVRFHFTIQDDPFNGIVLDNIKTQPSPVHVGDNIRFDATVTNHSNRPIQFIGGPCDSPLSAKFDKNVRTLSTLRCLAVGQPITLKPNESANITGPASGILYNASSNGKTIAQVSFSFNTRDSNGVVSPHQVTKDFQFVIGPPLPIVHSQ
jgi:hypothetical protein